jgi:SAM-dependent methyltransferase
MERRIYRQMQAQEDAHWWFAARREILASEIARLPLPRPARILEAGCGAGGNLNLLKRFGEVAAVEPDAESRAFAARRTGVRVEAGHLPHGLPDLGGPFDLVCAFDVVEHVEDDAGAVAALGAQAAPGGFLAVTVPAYAWMWSEHDVQHHHRRRYRRGAARALFERAGLKVRRATYFNTLLFPPIAAVRLAKKALGAEGGSDEAMPPAPLNAALKGMFAAEAALLRAGDLPFGVSILIVAERPA